MLDIDGGTQEKSYTEKQITDLETLYSRAENAVMKNDAELADALSHRVQEMQNIDSQLELLSGKRCFERDLEVPQTSDELQNLCITYHNSLVRSYQGLHDEVEGQGEFDQASIGPVRWQTLRDGLKGAGERIAVSSGLEDINSYTQCLKEGCSELLMQAVLNGCKMGQSDFAEFVQKFRLDPAGQLDAVYRRVGDLKYFARADKDPRLLQEAQLLEEFLMSLAPNDETLRK